MVYVNCLLIICKHSVRKSIKETEELLKNLKPIYLSVNLPECLQVHSSNKCSLTVLTLTATTILRQSLLSKLKEKYLLTTYQKNKQVIAPYQVDSNAKNGNDSLVNYSKQYHQR